jgi:hypothetical protein
VRFKHALATTAQSSARDYLPPGPNQTNRLYSTWTPGFYLHRLAADYSCMMMLFSLDANGYWSDSRRMHRAAPYFEMLSAIVRLSSRRRSTVCGSARIIERHVRIGVYAVDLIAGGLDTYRACRSSVCDASDIIRT